jgi:hypothetical protein
LRSLRSGDEVPMSDVRRAIVDAFNDVFGFSG